MPTYIISETIVLKQRETVQGVINRMLAAKDPRIRVVDDEPEDGVFVISEEQRIADERRKEAS